MLPYIQNCLLGTEALKKFLEQLHISRYQKPHVHDDIMTMENFKLYTIRTSGKCMKKCEG